MPEKLTIKTEALEPLFAAWEEPNKHRVRADSGEGAVERKGRRPTRIAIAQNLRAMVKEWRDTFYFGASDTSRYLLHHWFGRTHTVGTDGNSHEFRYYFCQREAMETLIYLKEVRKLECLSQLIAEYGGTYAETTALGVTEEEDAWSRYAFKMATGSGKTKVMSLAIVWSYFHALRESDSPMARHFIVIAPNLTVFERLKEDFKPAGGGPDIFDTDPLIPVEWRGDWNLTTVLQDEASGASTGGTLYLTNIHRLFENSRKRESGEMHDWMGPAVSKAKALDTGAARGVRWPAATLPPVRNLLRRRQAVVGEQWPAPPVRGLGSLIHTRVANSGGNFAGSTKDAAAVVPGDVAEGPLAWTST